MFPQGKSVVLQVNNVLKRMCVCGVSSSYWSYHFYISSVRRHDLSNTLYRHSPLQSTNILWKTIGLKQQCSNLYSCVDVLECRTIAIGSWFACDVFKFPKLPHEIGYCISINRFFLQTMWKVQYGGEDMIKCIQGLYEAEETGRFPPVYSKIPFSANMQKSRIVQGVLRSWVCSRDTCPLP